MAESRKPSSSQPPESQPPESEAEAPQLRAQEQPQQGQQPPAEQAPSEPRQTQPIQEVYQGGADIAERDQLRLRTESAGAPAGGRRILATDLGTHNNIERVAPGEGSGRMFEVMHGAVGPYTAGMLVPEEGFGEGANIDRLIRLGAVRELQQGGEQEEADLPSMMTLDEAARSDSPPTLPLAPGVDAEYVDLVGAAQGDLAALERATRADQTRQRAERLAAKRAEASPGRQ